LDQLHDVAVGIEHARDAAVRGFLELAPGRHTAPLELRQVLVESADVEAQLDARRLARAERTQRERGVARAELDPARGRAGGGEPQRFLVELALARELWGEQDDDAQPAHGPILTPSLEVQPYAFHLRVLAEACLTQVAAEARALDA